MKHFRPSLPIVSSVLALCIGALPAAAAPGQALIPDGLSPKAKHQVQAQSQVAPTTLPLVFDAIPCPGPGCLGNTEPVVQAQGQRTIYLNFDGVTITRSGGFGEDARQNQSRILLAPSLQIPALVPSHIQNDTVKDWTAAEIKSYIADTVRFHMTPYNVRVVTERPSSGNYHMVVFSPVADCEEVAGTTCAGIAPLDCGDDNANNVVWVFARELRLLDLATTASHEAAHSLGLSHTNDTDDIMYPSVLSSFPLIFGAGDVTDGANCLGQTFQDSDGLMLSTIGPAGVDTTGPVVQIVRPAEGLVVGGAAVVEVQVEDMQSAVGGVDLLINGERYRQAERDVRPFEFVVPPSTPNGPLQITAIARDVHGNESQATVNVEFQKGGSTPCTEDFDCQGGWSCDGTKCVAPDPNFGQLGNTCSTDEDCNSFCGTLDGESLCSQACDAETPCPDGFECRGGAACWPKSGGGCSAGRDSGSPLWLALALLTAFATKRNWKSGSIARQESP